MMRNKNAYSANEANDYVSVVYNAIERPLTSYPGKLARYLVSRFNIKAGVKLLDVGCGRGEFCKGFIKCGIDCQGVDMSVAAEKQYPDIIIKQTNLEDGNLPYSDNEFDCIFSKSMLEHFYYPEVVMREMYRVTKPGGLIITMVPDWHSVYQTTFYDDYTHRTPFTLNSLRDFLLIIGLRDVKVEKFKQLPILWAHPQLNALSLLVRILLPYAMFKHIKFVRFSKELMLLSHARKPF